MRISDWSSDVCSSDLRPREAGCGDRQPRRRHPALQGGRDLLQVGHLRFAAEAAAEDLRVGHRGQHEAAVPQGQSQAMQQHRQVRSEEHTSELQSLMRISYAVFCLKKKNTTKEP